MPDQNYKIRIVCGNCGTDGKEYLVPTSKIWFDHFKASGLRCEHCSVIQVIRNPTARDHAPTLNEMKIIVASVEKNESITVVAGPSRRRGDGPTVAGRRIRRL